MSDENKIDPESERLWAEFYVSKTEEQECCKLAKEAIANGVTHLIFFDKPFMNVKGKIKITFCPECGQRLIERET